jgi:diguanylate cyclase (GGDEF)-like protein
MPKPENGDQPHSPSYLPGLLRGARSDDILHALPTAVVLLDLDGTIAFANHVAQRQLGLHASGSKFVDMVEPADRMVVDGYLRSLQTTVDAGVSRYVACGLVSVDSTPLHVAITGAPVSTDGHRGLLLSLSDITAKRERDGQLMSMALTDPLTGLANRRSFLKSLSEAIQSGQGCVVAMADIDRFKLVNDQFGHDLGDQVLEAVAASLVQRLPANAVVPRLGGDEFAVLIPGAVDGMSLGQLEVLRQIEIPPDTRLAGPSQVSLSIGVTHTTAGDENDVLRVMVLPMAAPDALARVAEHLAQRIAELEIPHAEGPTGWLSALIVGVCALPLETVGQAIVRAGDEAMRCKATGVRAQIVLAA